MSSLRHAKSTTGRPALVHSSCYDLLTAELVHYVTQTCAPDDDTPADMELVRLKLEHLGFHVGQRLAERYAKASQTKQRLGTPLEKVKFLCKDFWIQLYGSQVDNLRTNNQGMFVIQDNKFKPFESLSAATESKTRELALPYTFFPCGIIRGALHNLGVPCHVKASIPGNLPTCKFTIDTTVAKKLPSTPDTVARRWASAGADGRVHVWDASTGKSVMRLSPPAHLRLRLTCLSWLTRKPSKGQKQSLADALAVGTGRGTVLLWKPAHGTSLTRIGSQSHGHSTRVTGLAWAPNAMLYSCSADGMVIVWNANEGTVLRKFTADKHGLRGLALDVAGTRLLSASTMLRLWDISSWQCSAKFAGHVKPVQWLSWSPCSSAADIWFSCSHDRYINVWHKDQQDPIQVLSCLHAPHAFATFAVSSTTMVLAALSDTGRTVFVWEWRTPSTFVTGRGSGSSKRHKAAEAKASEAARREPKTPQLTLELPGSPSNPALGRSSSHHIIGLTFTDTNTLLLAMGGAVPFFHSVKVRKAGKLVTPKLTLDTPSLDRGRIQVAHASHTAAGPGVSVLTATGRAGAVPLWLPLDPTLEAGGDADDSDAMDVQAEEGPSPGADAAGVAPLPTMGERLRALGLDGRDVARAQGKVGRRANGGAIPQANSLQATVSQALRTHDAYLLEQCLASTDASIIRNTVQRLPAPHVLPLLTHVMARLEARPSRAVLLMPWLLAMLTTRMTYLVTLPNVGKTLATLYHIVESRVAAYDKLVRLQGRLDLLLSQATSRQVLDHQNEAGATFDVMVDHSGEEEDSSSGGEEDGDSLGNDSAASVSEGDSSVDDSEDPHMDDDDDSSSE